MICFDLMYVRMVFEFGFQRLHFFIKIEGDFLRKLMI